MYDAFDIPKLSSKKLTSWTKSRATVDGPEILHQSMGSRATIDLHGCVYIPDGWLNFFHQDLIITLRSNMFFKKRLNHEDAGYFQSWCWRNPKSPAPRVHVSSGVHKHSQNFLSSGDCWCPCLFLESKYFSQEQWVLGGFTFCLKHRFSIPDDLGRLLAENCSGVQGQLLNRKLTKRLFCHSNLGDLPLTPILELHSGFTLNS